MSFAILKLQEILNRPLGAFAGPKLVNTLVNKLRCYASVQMCQRLLFFADQQSA